MGGGPERGFLSFPAVLTSFLDRFEQKRPLNQEVASLRGESLFGHQLPGFHARMRVYHPFHCWVRKAGPGPMDLPFGH